MMARRDAVMLASAGAFAVLVPVLLLGSVPAPRPAAAKPAPQPIAVPQPAPIADAYRRPLFAAADPAAVQPAPGPEEAAPPADAPALIGIVGRIGVDAVALVRTAAGATRTLAIGESVDGWQLAALALDAAYFTRGTGRVRVPLPAGQ